MSTMKTMFATSLVMSLAASVVHAQAVPARATGCAENIREIQEEWSNHLHQRGGKDAIHWQGIKSILDHAVKDCAAGKNAEASENARVVRDRLAMEEFGKGSANGLASATGSQRSWR